MKRILVFVAVALFLVASGPVNAADHVPVSNLLADGERFEGEITIAGELVGDYGVRGDGWVWGQLNEDPYASEPVLEGGALAGGNVGVGVRIPGELAADLGPPGGYRRLGPLVELTGTWIYHDESRGGESYLQVESMIVVNEGRDLHEEPGWWRYALGGTLLAAAGLLRLGRRRTA